MYHLWTADNCLPQEQIHCLVCNHSFFTLFTRMCYQSLSSVIQSAPSHYISLSSLLYLDLHTFRFTDYNSICITHISCACYLHIYVLAIWSSCIWSPQHMQWTAQITKLLITPLCDLLVTFTPRMPKYLPQHPVQRLPHSDALYSVKDQVLYKYLLTLCYKHSNETLDSTKFIMFPQTVSQSSLPGYIYGGDNKKFHGSGHATPPSSQPSPFHYCTCRCPARMLV